LAILSNHQPGEIAKNRRELNKETKVYIGPLFPHIFKDYPNLIHTSYSDGEIRRESIEVGVKSVEQLKQEIEKDIKTSSIARHMMESPDFTASESPKVFNLVILKVGDMGFDREPTTEELNAKAKELGLDFCPPSVCIEFRLKYKDQPRCECLYVPKELNADSKDKTHIFTIDRHSGELWLRDSITTPDSYWNFCDSVVFCLPNQS
jgi:hypothetical protein